MEEWKKEEKCKKKKEKMYILNDLYIGYNIINIIINKNFIINI